MLAKLALVVAADDALSTKLERLSYYRSRHRRLQDGRLCASVFRHDNVLYSGCTSVPPPGNSSVSGKEWCYVNEQLLDQAGKLDWGFCSPPNEYEQIREAAMQARESAVRRAQNAQEEAQKEEAARIEALNALKALCTVDAPVVLNEVLSLTEMAAKVDKMQESTSFASRELASIKQSIQDLKQKKGKDEKLDAYGAVLYAFDNSNFRGAPKTQSILNTVDKIFETTGEIFVGVAGDNYSFRITGYILPFISGDYTFVVQSSLGATLFIESDLVINYNIGYPSYSPPNFPPTRPWPSEVAERPVNESMPVTLKENKPLKFTLDIMFTQNLMLNVNATSFFRLQWKPPGTKTYVTIPNFNLLQVIDGQTIRVDSLKGPSAKDWTIDELIPGTLMFSDNQDDYVGDVSNEYLGSRCFKSPQSGSDSLNVQLSQPSVLTVFKPERTRVVSAECGGLKIQPTDVDAHLTLYKTENGSSRAKSQQTYQGSLLDATNCTDPIDIKFSNGPAVVSFNASKSKGGCESGALRPLSDPSSRVYRSCIDSDGRDCMLALKKNPTTQAELLERDGRKDHYKVRRNLPVSLNIQFTKPVKVSKLMFLPLPDVMSWPTLMRLYYATEMGVIDSEYIRLNQSRSLSHQHYNLSLKQPVSRVTIEIVQTAGQAVETGGYFTLLGYDCATATSGEAKISSTKAQSCLDTLDTVGIATIGRVQCPGDCNVQADVAQSMYGGKNDDQKPVLSVIRTPICLAAQRLQLFTRDPPIVEVARLNTYKDLKPLNDFLPLSKDEPSYTITESLPFAATSNASHYEARIMFATFRESNIQVPYEFRLDKGGLLGKKESDNDFGWLHTPILVHGQSKSDLHAGLSFQMNDLDSVACQEDATKCLRNKWVMTVPHEGEYRLEILLGHLSEPMKGVYYNFLQVNGEPLISQLALRAGRSYWFSALVDIRDRQLVLTANCDAPNQAICKESLTTINFLIVTSA